MAQSMGIGGMPNIGQKGGMPQQQLPQMQQMPQQPTQQAAQSPLTQAAMNGLVEANKPVL